MVSIDGSPNSSVLDEAIPKRMTTTGAMTPCISDYDSFESDDFSFLVTLSKNLIS